MSIHEEENACRKDQKITSDFLCSETIKNPDRVFYGDEVEQHVPYEQDEISYEGSHGDVPENSVFSPVFEEEFLDQIYQHYDDMPKDDYENNENHNICGAIYLEEKPFSKPCYDQFLKREDEMETNVYNKEEVSEVGLKIFSNISTNQILNKTEAIFSMTDQKHKGVLFSMDYNAPEDLSKAKQELDTKDCIDEARTVCITHKNNTFDTGMKYEQHTEVSILEDPMVIFANNMLREMFLSFYYFSFEGFSSMYIEQMNEARDQMFDLNDSEMYFFSFDPIDKAMVRIKSRQVINETHMSCDDCFICTNGSDFTNERYDIIFRTPKVLHDQNRVFDRGKNRCSFLGGLGPPNFTVHHAQHRCSVCSSRDS